MREKGSLLIKINNFSFVGVIVFLTVVLGFSYIFSNDAYATNSTISLSIDNPLINVNVFPKSPSGDFSKSDNGTISVTTNNYSGYTLKIAASSSTDLVNTLDSSKTISSISDIITEADFKASSSTSFNGKWGYLPSKYDSSDNTYFRPSPGTGNNGHTLDTTSIANSTANTYTLAIGARVDNSTTPGTYNNTFVLSAVANVINYTITYDKGNTTDTVTNLPANTTGVIADPVTGSTDVTLPLTKPEREGFVFDGWCTAIPIVSSGDPDSCPDITIQSGGTYSINATTSPAITLYALWKPETLYNKVASMSKGTQTLADMQGGVSEPTSEDRSQDTSNSGVYEYNENAFGSHSDMSDEYMVYYYRGILDSSGYHGSYGSDGHANVYPNYVRLGEDGGSCWRIIRTTGSGGVKMIYNGEWTGSSCGNAGVDAQLSSLSNWSGTSTNHANQVVRVGYTYNGNYANTSSTSSVNSNLVFGSDSDYSMNTTIPPVKTSLEDWFYTNISTYSSIMETSAGYCNNRQPYNISGSIMNTVIPYSTNYSANVNFFGNGSEHYMLQCIRGIVDTYSSDSNDGGNGQLGAPAALITANEAEFSGLGTSVSFLNTGSAFWTMTPFARSYVTTVNASGTLEQTSITKQLGIRPVISLKVGTSAISGSGTATDPWVVAEPPGYCDTNDCSHLYMQNISKMILSDIMPNVGDTCTLYDSRDEKAYMVTKEADGHYWMTQNLDLDIGGSGGTTFTSENTDLTTYSTTASNVYGSNAGYTKSGDIITWTPSSDAYTAAHTITGTTVYPAMGTSTTYGTIPQSAEGGNTYIYTSGITTDDTVYASLSACVAEHNDGTCPHYHVGNYYNWSAAIASNASSSISSQYTVAANSICPAGWRLPKGLSNSTSSATTREFGQLLYSSGVTSSLTATSYATDGFNMVRSNPLFFVRGGYISGSSLNSRAQYGNYWSSTVISSSNTYFMGFDSWSPSSAESNSFRYFGRSVRCMVR